MIPARWADQAAIRHRCDEPSCQNWTAHLLPGTSADNIADYQLRRGREFGPLADVRGAWGRAVAIRDAILAARTWSSRRRAEALLCTSGQLRESWAGME